MKPETLAVIDSARRERCSFLTEEDVKAIASDPETRLSMLLVRCGNGRFMAPAQDVQHFITIIEKGELPESLRQHRDHVRDVSLPVGFKVQGDPPKPRGFACNPGLRCTPIFDERDCSGAFDGTNVISDADEGL